jgi:hypothetical protein
VYLCAHLELDDLDPVCYDGRFVALVESVVEHLNGIVVKLVRETRPVEGEGHFIAGGRRARTSPRKEPPPAIVSLRL